MFGIVLDGPIRKGSRARKKLTNKIGVLAQLTTNVD